MEERAVRVPTARSGVRRSGVFPLCRSLFCEVDLTLSHKYLVLSLAHHVKVSCYLVQYQLCLLRQSVPAGSPAHSSRRQRKQQQLARAAVMTAPEQPQVESAVIKIGTRGSPLAMAQAYQTKDRLQV